ELTRDLRPAVPGQTDSVWHHPHLYWGALAIFVYVGAEVSIGSFLINYFNDPQIGNLPLATAANYLIFYWGGAMVGRFIGALALQYFKPGRALALCALVAAGLVALSMLTFGHVAMISILAVGLFNSIMFPTIFALALAELGPLTGKGSGLLVFSIVGGAIIPLAQGALADRMGLHHAFFLPVICYAFIAWYGMRGSRVVVA
ncbi:MAG TPA: glucose/galactose MFS transporter, partial [Acidobacteriaceae bacterium]